MLSLLCFVQNLYEEWKTKGCPLGLTPHGYYRETSAASTSGLTKTKLTATIAAGQQFPVIDLTLIPGYVTGSTVFSNLVGSPDLVAPDGTDQISLDQRVQTSETQSTLYLSAPATKDYTVHFTFIY